MMKSELLLLIMFSALCVQAGVNGDLRRGSKLYQKGKYGEAYANFSHALQQDPHNSSAAFGAGASAYFLQDYDQAAQAFETAADRPGKLQQDAWFNLGNTYYRSKNKEKAVAAYKQAILQNPHDKEAMHNLQLLLQEQQAKNNNDQNQQNQDENSQNQDKQQQDNKGQAPQQDKQKNQPSKTPQNSQEQQAKQAADRVLQLARESEYKNPNHSGPAQQDPSLEKDW